MFLIDEKISVDKPLTSRTITKYDNVSLQFTTARFITNYDNVLLQITIAWLLQFSVTTVITIYDNCYNYNLRQVLQFMALLQFTTKQPYLCLNFSSRLLMICHLLDVLVYTNIPYILFKKWCK